MKTNTQPLCSFPLLQAFKSKEDKYRSEFVSEGLKGYLNYKERVRVPKEVLPLNKADQYRNLEVYSSAQSEDTLLDDLKKLPTKEEEGSDLEVTTDIDINPEQLAIDEEELDLNLDFGIPEPLSIATEIEDEPESNETEATETEGETEQTEGEPEPETEETETEPLPVETEKTEATEIEDEPESNETEEEGELTETEERVEEPTEAEEEPEPLPTTEPTEPKPHAPVPKVPTFKPKAKPKWLKGLFKPKAKPKAKPKPVFKPPIPKAKPKAKGKPEPENPHLSALLQSETYGLSKGQVINKNDIVDGGEVHGETVGKW